MSSATGRPAAGSSASGRPTTGDPASGRPAAGGPTTGGPASEHLDDDHALAARLAAEAGDLLLELRKDPDLSKDPDALGKAGDRLSHELLARRLAEHRPNDALLSEEAPDDHSRLDSRRVWIVDPLDGTSQYEEHPRKDWAVHVALTVDGHPAVGAVALPAENRALLSTASPPELAPAPPQAPPPAPPQKSSRPRPPVVVASRSRRVPQAEAIVEHLGSRLLRIGSVGAKTAAVIEGKADLYVHSGGQWEWDSAAPAAVALACGLWVSRLDGSPLRYNLPNPYVEDLLFCRPELAESALAFLAGLAGQTREG